MRAAPRSTSPRRSIVLPLVALTAVVCGTAVAEGVARAQGETADSGEEEARRLFGDGSRLFLAGRYDEALTALQGSYKLVPSPNSGLLIARCLRELGRPVEAAAMFSAVETEARRRVTDGDARYAQTADAAATEGARVRAGLGRLHVEVKHASPGTQLTVDGQAVEIPPDREVVVLHGAGVATVRLIPAAGAEQSQSATVTAGSDVRMAFEMGPHVDDGAGGGPPPPKGPEPEHHASWYVPAAWISGGVAVAGLGVFTGFGLASKSKFDDLQSRCGAAGCGPADRADADAGKRDQTIANIGLAVGLIGAAATGIFIALAVQDDHAASPGHAQLGVGPGSATLRVRF